MKVIAIGSVVKVPTEEQKAEVMPKEVPATLKLYLEGTVEQHWFRTDKPGVVFLMDVESVEAANRAVAKLPLTATGFMSFEMIPVGPLAPLGLLIAGK